MRYLILENDKTVDEVILSFVDSSYFKDGDEFPVISRLSHHDFTKDNHDELNECQTYIFRSTFTNREQISKILDLINCQPSPKKLYINYTSDRLYIALRDIYNKYPDKIDEFRKNGHSIYEIEYERKQGANSDKFFKEFLYFFDLIPYYWNSDHQTFVPERPKCIYEDSNIKDLFKYKPKWKLV